jgi:hypothetical protein
MAFELNTPRLFKRVMRVVDRCLRNFSSDKTVVNRSFDQPRKSDRLLASAHR